MKKPMLEFVDIEALKKAAQEEGYILPSRFEQDLEVSLRAFMTRFHPRIVGQQKSYGASRDMSRAKRALFTEPSRYDDWLYKIDEGVIRGWSPEFFNPKRGVSDEPSTLMVSYVMLMKRAMENKSYHLSVETIRERIPRTLRRQKGFYAYVVFRVGRKEVTVENAEKPAGKGAISIPTRRLYDNLIAFDKGDILTVSKIAEKRGVNRDWFILLRKENLQILLKSV